MAGSEGNIMFDSIDLEGRQLSRRSNSQKDEEELLWAAIERLPTTKRLNLAIVRGSTSDDNGVGNPVDVRKLDRRHREMIVLKALDTSEQDNFKLLSGVKERITKVGLEVPKVEVRFKDLCVTAQVQTGRRALPTLINYTRDFIEGILSACCICRPQRRSLRILKNVSGVLKPGRMTLLLGPPGGGKSTLLLALSGKLDSSLKKTGCVTYNGHEMSEFRVERTSAYVSQTDNHVSEMTVRETFDFAARCQGASDSYSAYMKDLNKLEKQTKIRPSPEIDAFMKASSVAGKKHSISTDYILKVLGLDNCADTMVGNDMARGISGGQKKRVTTGEMIAGPKKTIFMDEISTGLDSATTYQIVKCIGNFVHEMEGTVLMALLQPAPETFELFDDLILLSDGHIVYQGPRVDVLAFFESLGFQLPPRKGVADFLQEVTSRNDQAQYWADSSRDYRFIPVEEMAEAFRTSRFGRAVTDTLSVPYDKSRSHPLALARTTYAVPKMELFKACLSREVLLMRRNSFLYIFKTCQIAFVGFVAATTFTRAILQPTSVKYGNYYLACLFYAIIFMMFNGLTDLSLTLLRLPVYYKQRDNRFYSAWAWSLSSWLLKVPYSAVETIVWALVVYYSVGLDPSPSRFFRYLLLLFVVHQSSLSLFRLLAAVARDMTLSYTVASFVLLVLFCVSGFILPKSFIKPWWVWSFWLSPLSYAQIAVSVNEFTATRWMKTFSSGNTTLGEQVLKLRSLPTDPKFYWIGVGVLVLYTIFLNVLTILALAYLNPLKTSQTVIPVELSEDDKAVNGGKTPSTLEGSSSSIVKNKGMILPFQPLSMTFHNVNYFVDMPKAMKANGVPERKLQLLSDVSGVFSPGVLTALVGSSGAGKTTLMDVLAGRKTGGYIEGDIRISGFPKKQHTFARVSGYVEQFDIHSPQVTVEESLWFSSSLRLPKEISKETKKEFVNEVMRLVELDSLRDALVGFPGRSGLSTEQRKRLTIGVELVANPSIIFMDEPTSGLDARAAAIVMRTVRNTVDTGRTVVCTIHQPSIDIFEAFDELLLMKRGGRVIYGGKLGFQSQTMINYFQGINGVPPISDGYNPATWMLEVTTPAIEESVGEDFANIYRNSNQYREVEASIQQMSTPPPGSEPLHFDTTFSQDIISQFKICLKKQALVYWRTPQYNAVRFYYATVCGLILGSMFWDIGSKRDSVIGLVSIMGALFATCMFLGANSASSVQPVISVERTVFYREKAAGMYSPLAYAAAQALVEIPYIVAQTLLYGVITFFMIGFERTFKKFALFIVFTFLSFTNFTFYGMMVVGLTPNLHMASILTSAFYSLWNLQSGFLIPTKFIPKWWIWFNYIDPLAWTIKGIVTSQLGDITSMINDDVFKGTVQEYLELNYGFRTGMTGISVAVLLCFSLFFCVSFMLSIRYLNFQKR
ncbi:hypothetical protein vseg_010125 [Gypsophila vaccaria]